MQPLTSLLSLDGVLLDAAISTRKRAFEEASLMIERAAGISHQLLFDAFFARERLGSTCLGQGAALPRARVEGLRRTAVAVLRSAAPVDMDSPDGRRARLFLFIAAPEENPDAVQPVLLRGMALLSSRAMREALLAAPDAEALCEAVAAWEAGYGDGDAGPRQRIAGAIEELDNA
ncbi:MAG: PTS sugar transporter subunit IIA [Duodenibacillus sp.]|nr:PTS sugar transporter subunit IIA [Duodenibacillus sp.]